MFIFNFSPLWIEREMQSSSKVGELKTNFLFWDKEPLHLVEKEKGLVPYLDFFSSAVPPAGQEI